MNKEPTILGTILTLFQFRQMYWFSIYGHQLVVMACNNCDNITKSCSKR